MLVVAISSRALFDFNEENSVYENKGLHAYKQYQIANENIPLSKGVCFPLVEKLLNLNTYSKSPLVEVILCSRNSADSGLRVFNTIAHYNLPITRAIFSDGQPVHQYLKPYGVHLFLSANDNDVRESLNIHIAAATVLQMPDGTSPISDNKQLRIAFDADCVLFSDAIEKINQKHGLKAFSNNEKINAHKLLPHGPFSSFIQEFSMIQNTLADKSLIRTALVTARSAPAHERVIRTLRAWNVTMDESFFLGGINKTNILSAYQPDIFFDDLYSNCNQSAKAVPTGHVPYGITNN